MGRWDRSALPRSLWCLKLLLTAVTRMWWWCQVIETSGVTDPARIIAVLDQRFGKMTRARLDSVVTVSAFTAPATPSGTTQLTHLDTLPPPWSVDGYETLGDGMLLPKAPNTTIRVLRSYHET
jgi:hypothetical protein